MKKTYLTIMTSIVILCSGCTGPVSDSRSLHSQSFHPPVASSIKSGTRIATWQGGNKQVSLSGTDIITATAETSSHDIIRSRNDSQTGIPLDIQCSALIKTPTITTGEQLTVLYQIKECVPQTTLFDKELLALLENRSTQRYKSSRDMVNPSIMLSGLLHHSFVKGENTNSEYPEGKQRYVTDEHPLTRTHTGNKHHETIAVSLGSFEWYKRHQGHISQLTLHTSPKKYKMHYQYKVGLDSSQGLSIQGDRTAKDGRQGTATIPTNLFSYYNNLPIIVTRTLKPSLSLR